MPPSGAIARITGTGLAYPYPMTHAVGSNRPYSFPSSPSEGGEVATKITITPDSNASTHAAGFFGADGPSFADVLDAINPLKHIPIVSDLIYDKPEEKSSVAANLVSGALMGGPVGFVASLANEIFKEATGKGIAETAYAALTGDSPAATQLAVNEAAPVDAVEVAEASAEASADIPTNAMHASSAASANDIAQRAQLGLVSSSATDAYKTDDDRANKLLELFGGSKPSASKAYQNAQMLPYLKQANTNQLL